MRSHVSLFLFLGPIALFAQGTWIPRNGLTEGPARWGCAEFVIDGVGYVVGGRTSTTDLNELRAFTAVTESWQAKAPLPGGARRLASAFSVGGKGYVTCGLFDTASLLADLWEYDPDMDSWTQKADLPAGSRYSAASFSINGIGYVVCGNMGSATGPYSSELWAYDPVNDNWTARASLPDQARYAAKAFVTDGKGYVFGGKRADLSFTNDLWAYDPESDTWSSRAALPGVARVYAYVWSLPERAIVMGGDDPGLSNLQDCWSYNPYSNAWSPLATYTGSAYWGGTSMVITGRIYAGLGRYGTAVANDLWELRDPFLDVDEHETEMLSITPNPVASGGVLTVSLAGSAQGIPSELTLHNAQGQLVFRMRVADPPMTSITLPALPSGSYIAAIRGDGQLVARTVITIVD